MKKAPIIATGLATAVVLVLALLWLLSKPASPPVPTPPIPAVVTFNKDIAPILHQHCAGCHHPGEAAPFDLITYADARKRARQIAEVTHRRQMPPWLPDAADGPFVGQRALDAATITLLEKWVEQGSPEGPPSAPPPAPQWRDSWTLGEPDLVIRMTEPFTLAAEGADTYRNFVIPIPTATRRFVKGVELRPSNARIVHHAFLRIDASGDSRRRDAEDTAPGFSGLHTPPGAQTPAGQFLSWQPGKRHTFVPPGLAWKLETNSDLVLQMHLRPNGKPEVIQSSVAFFFTEEPPTNTPFKIGLLNFDIDIPADEARHLIRDSYTLAADVELLSVLPHAHYLGKDLQVFATTPDGAQRRLLRIANWDFNWQGDYLFQQPVFLPKGTTLRTEYLYDNSTNNARNPHQPPRRVRYGLQSSDEMAELWLQVLPRHTNDLAVLARADQPRTFRGAIAYNQYLLALNPNDARAHNEIGKTELFLGRHAEAGTSLRRAVALDPAFDEPHYFLGLSFRMRKQTSEALEEFATATRLNPANAKAHGNLGLIFAEQGRLDDAEVSLRAALRLNPADEIARQTLDEIAQARARAPK